MPHRYFGVVPPNDYGIPPSNMTISADGRATWADRMGGMMSDNAVNDPRVEIYFDDDGGKPLVDNRNGTLDTTAFRGNTRIAPTRSPSRPGARRS